MQSCAYTGQGALQSISTGRWAATNVWDRTADSMDSRWTPPPAQPSETHTSASTSTTYQLLQLSLQNRHENQHGCYGINSAVSFYSISQYPSAVVCLGGDVFAFSVFPQNRSAQHHLLTATLLTCAYQQTSRSASFSQNIITGHAKTGIICASSVFCFFLIFVYSFKEKTNFPVLERTEFTALWFECYLWELFIYTTVSYIPLTLLSYSTNIKRSSLCFRAVIHVSKWYSFIQLPRLVPTAVHPHLLLTNSWISTCSSGVSSWTGIQGKPVIVNCRHWKVSSSPWSSLEINQKMSILGTVLWLFQTQTLKCLSWNLLCNYQCPDTPNQYTAV